MEEKNTKVKTPVKIGLVEFLFIFMTCTVVALGAIYFLVG